MLRSTIAPKLSIATVRKSALDGERMRALAVWTARSLEAEHPVPFGAEIFHSKTGERLMQVANAWARKMILAHMPRYARFGWRARSRKDFH